MWQNAMLLSFGVLLTVVYIELRLRFYTDKDEDDVSDAGVTSIVILLLTCFCWGMFYYSIHN